MYKGKSMEGNRKERDKKMKIKEKERRKIKERNGYGQKEIGKVLERVREM